MLSPKKTKFRKYHRASTKGIARGNSLAFGDFGLQAVEASWVTSRQIEAGRRCITRYIKRTGKMWIRIFPDTPMTMRAAETRMGAGKGNPEFWVAVVKRQCIIYEINGVSETIAREALRIASHAMPMKTKIISKEAK